MKYKQWLNVWLENYVRPDSKMRTTQSYERIINKYITVALGEKELADINTADIQTFVTRLLTDVFGQVTERYRRIKRTMYNRNYGVYRTCGDSSAVFILAVG